MDHPIVRLSALTLKNIKNVKNGTVCMPSVSNVPSSFKADILGIYGQNGSGKTAIVDIFLTADYDWKRLGFRTC